MIFALMPLAVGLQRRKFSKFRMNDTDEFLVLFVSRAAKLPNFNTKSRMLVALKGRLLQCTLTLGPVPIFGYFPS